ncbi:hypothetical protein RhiirC2_711860 [Rhizophagus irregularis]|uniref:Uncharacterized protein n=1 Tax=Rhizophagus irregularis TaxID=588596 RepID=A0A2N1N9A3_9GLOM|nr:hypothetical protein RhiirC2_711860 [Rhizophagus irregularis]
MNLYKQKKKNLEQYFLKKFLDLKGDVTKKEFSMRPEFEIIGEESSGRADYAIKSDSDNLGSARQVVFNIKKLKFLVKNIKLTQRVGSSSCGLWVIKSCDPKLTPKYESSQ